MKTGIKTVKDFFRNWGFQALLILFMVYYYSLPVPA